MELQALLDRIPIVAADGIVEDLIDRVPALASILATVGIVLLLPLFISQRRDVRRLRDWMAREPDHPKADLAASETLLDRAEAELEELLGEPAQPTEVRSAPAGAAARVTHERPALERITMEREALAPHPHWRHFVARATQPRILVIVGLTAIAVAVGGILLSEVILDEQPARIERAQQVDRSETTVAVLNGTAQSGLAGDVGADVTATGYRLGTVTNATRSVDETLVLYADGQEAVARRVARDLGVDPEGVEPLDRESRLLAGDGADVVVIAGEDRAP